MTRDLDDDAVTARLIEPHPDPVGVPAITPSIYAAERLLKLARTYTPRALRVLDGMHATFMYEQVLSEAPWIDLIVRAEGQDILRNVVRTLALGDFENSREQIKGIALRQDKDDFHLDDSRNIAQAQVFA